MTTREVVLEGGSPWGFRIHGGVDTESPLRISRVNSNGKAGLKGIQQGDIISSINGHPTTSFTCSEAHTFIKNSGDTLKLELSNDSGSTRQRKRNKATIHETNSETLKSTSSTLYSRTSSKTIFSDNTNENNDPGQSFREHPSLEGQNRTRQYPDPPLSPISTVSSDVSSSSTLTETGNDGQSITDVTSLQLNIDMADRVNSKSKKKRSKKQKKKSKKSSENVKYETKATVEENPKTEEIASEDYKVDFPETVTSNPKMKVKSKSWDDDDDSLKIQEITGFIEEGKQECEAIISEADSDWEEATDLRVPHKPIALSTIAISIDEEPLQRIEVLSPEEELSLRNFLEGIDLVSVDENLSSETTLDTIKREKTRKREALAKYFKPLVHNPRYLDIISEEGSDLSDRETPSLTQHLKQGTPELEYLPKDSLPLSPKITRRRDLKRVYVPQKRDKALLLCTKVVNTPSIIEHIHTHVTENIEAEKVFLESSSTSSKDSSDSDETSSEERNMDGEEGNTEHELEHKPTSLSELTNSNFENDYKNEAIKNTNFLNSKLSDSIIISISNDFKVLEEYDQKNIKDENKCTVYSSTTNIDSDNTCVNEKVTPTYYDELTPPPTPDFSPKNPLSAKSSMDLEECMKQISTDAAREITSVLCKLTPPCNSEIIINQAFTFSSEKSSQSVSSRSPSRSSSSSRDTSPSTVRLNKMNSSIADVTSILPDLELAKEALLLKQPLSLRQICLNCLFSLPCGAEMLQELCDISLNLDKLTQALNRTQNLLESDASATVSNHTSISETMEKLTNTIWTGIPFHNTPNLLLCLSPTQKAYLDKSGISSEESEILFDLHAKFVKRADQNYLNNDNKTDTQMTPIQGININRNGNASGSMNYSTIPRNIKHITHNPRLQASNLGEWLTIARNDISSSQADTKFESKNHFTPLPEAAINDNPGSTQRRASLPDDLCKRQMHYILEKEKEIEQELHKLLEEKRKLQLEMENEETHNFRISLDASDKTRPKSFPSVPSEVFRQKMYEEYMNQFAEREERKQKKVIKITSSPSNKLGEKEKPLLEVTHVAEIEEEFMKKVQELHGTLHKIEEEKEVEGAEISKLEPGSGHESVILMDGTSLKDATSLPKHLKEFVEITSECSKVDSTNGESA